MAKETVKIILRGAASVTPPNSRRKILKDRPIDTSDPALIRYCRSRPGLFQVLDAEGIRTEEAVQARKAVLARRRSGMGSSVPAESRVQPAPGSAANAPEPEAGSTPQRPEDAAGTPSTPSPDPTPSDEDDGPETGDVEPVASAPAKPARKTPAKRKPAKASKAKTARKPATKRKPAKRKAAAKASK